MEKRLVFFARDFEIDSEHGKLGPTLAAETANALLPSIKQAWLEELRQSGVVVYGHEWDEAVAADGNTFAWGHKKQTTDTHTALLIDVRKL